MAVSQQAIKAGEAFVEATLRDVSFSVGLDRIKAKFRAVSLSLRELSTMGIALGVAMLPVVSTFIKYDDAMLKLRAMTDGTDAEFNKLAESTLEMGRNTSFTATEVAGLMTELGKAGFTRSQIDLMTQSVLDLARATGTDAALSAEILGATLRQFRLEAKDTSRVADLLTATANKSAVSVTDLGVSLSYAGTVAAQNKMSLEDTLAILGTLGNVGIKGDMAGTSIRRLVSVVTAGGKDIKRIFGEGIEVGDIVGDPRKLIDVMKDIEDSTKNLTAVERTEKFKEFFDLLGITGASVLSRGTDDVNGFRDALDNVKGSAASAARDMDSGLGGAWRRTKASAEAIAIAVGTVLAPALGAVAKVLSLITDKFLKWIDENKELATNIGIAVVGVLTLLTTGAAIYAMSFAFSGLAIAVGLVVAVVKLLVAGLALLLSPVGIVLALFGLLLAQSDSISEAIGYVILAMAIPIAVVVIAVKVLIGVFKALGYMVEAVFDFIKENVSGFAEGLGVIKRWATEVGAQFETMAKEVGAIFGEMFDGIRKAISKGDITLAFRIMMTGLSAVWLAVNAYLLEQWQKFGNSVLDFFDNVIIGIRIALIDLLEWMSNKMIGAVEITVIPVLRLIDSLDPIKATATREADAQKKLNDVKATVKGLRDGVEKAVTDESVASRKKRNDAQAEEVKGIRDKQKALLDYMRDLIRVANIEIAPMPHEPPNLSLTAPDAHDLGRVLSREVDFGAAARGTFQSGDFAGLLGIGGANEAAKESAKRLGSIDSTLKNIEQKLEPDTFK